MTIQDLRNEYTERTFETTETHGLFYEGYVVWLEKQVLALRIHFVVGRSEQFICPCCGSDKTYKTEAYHCNRCAVTTEV